MSRPRARPGPLAPQAGALRVVRPVDAVVERLRQRILAGTYPAATHLPPERQLAAELGISRLTLRAGLARLEAEGLVRARQGDGVLVLDVAEHATLGVLAHLSLSSRPEAFRSLLELRRAVAAEAVALACERARPKDLLELERLFRAQRDESDPTRYAARDLEFARAVLKAAHSLAGLLLFNALAPVYQAHPELSGALLEDRERSLAGYALTLSLLKGRDPAAAREQVRAGLQALDEAALRALGPRPKPRKRRRRARRDHFSSPRHRSRP